MVSFEQPIGFGVVDDGFDGASSSEFAADGGRRDTAHSRDEHASFSLVAVPQLPFEASFFQVTAPYTN